MLRKARAERGFSDVMHPPRVAVRLAITPEEGGGAARLAPSAADRIHEAPHNGPTRGVGAPPWFR